MDMSKELKKIMIDEGENISSIATKLGTTQQNLHAKFKRNNFRLNELKEIADLLGYDINVIFEKKD